MPEVLAPKPQKVERSIGKMSTALHQPPEVDPALIVYGDDLTVQDDFQAGQLGAEALAQCVKLGESIPALAVNRALAACQVNHATKAVVLGLEQPARIVERHGSKGGDDRLDPRQADKGASKHVGMCNLHLVALLTGYVPHHKVDPPAATSVTLMAHPVKTGSQKPRVLASLRDAGVSSQLLTPRRIHARRAAKLDFL